MNFCGNHCLLNQPSSSRAINTYPQHPPFRNIERHPTAVVRLVINQHHQFNGLDQLRAQCVMQLQHLYLIFIPRPIACKQILTPKVKTFLEAYPTKTFTAAQLQALLPIYWALARSNVLPEIMRLSVPRDSFEFGHVAQMFRAPIEAVERIENPYLCLMYKLKSEECRLFFKSQELHLFHGTSIQKIESIIRDNFDYRLAGSCVGHVHGYGVYFSSCPFTCRRYSWKGKSNCMIMARVQHGRIFRGNAELVIPPEEYDTSGNSHIFAKYYDHQFYPEYLIYY